MKREKVEFFDSILGEKSNLFDKNTHIEIEEDKPVVNTGGPIVIKAMNGLEMMNKLMADSLKTPPTIPTLEDIKKARPDIYDSYVKMANNNTLIIFEPGNFNF